MDKNKELLKIKGVITGKECIRYSSPDKINFEVVAKMLREPYTSTDKIC